MSTRYYERFQDVQDYLQPLREQSGLNIPDWYDHEIPPIGLHAEVTVKVFYIKVPVACLEQVDDTIAIKDNFKESILPSILFDKLNVSCFLRYGDNICAVSVYLTNNEASADLIVSQV